MAGKWKSSLKLALGLFAVLTINPAIAAPSKAQVESQYRNWIEKDLWPEAKAAGVSRAVFEQAFAGVTINWKLPDLVIPGEKPTTPKEQKQAEFGAPGKYFNARTLGSVTSGGKARLGQNASLLKESSSNMVCRAVLSLRFGAADPALARSRFLIMRLKCLAPKLLWQRARTCSARS